MRRKLLLSFALSLAMAATAAAQEPAGLASVKPAARRAMLKQHDAPQALAAESLTGDAFARSLRAVKPLTHAEVADRLALKKKEQGDTDPRDYATNPTTGPVAVKYQKGPKGDIITIGDGSGTGNYMPVYPYFDYSIGQTIYLADEIGTAGTINSIAYHACKTLSNITGAQDWEVWMGHTDMDAFPSKDASNWVTGDQMEKVFDGQVSAFYSGDWLTITLDTPFEYDGASNLVVCVLEKTPGYPGNNGAYFYTTTTEGIRSAGLIRDGSSYTVAMISEGSLNNSQSNNMGGNVIPNIQLDIDPAAAAAVDAALTGFTAPTGLLMANEEFAVKATLRNRGSEALMSAVVTWILNGVDQTPVPWSGNLANGETTEVTLGNLALPGGDYTVVATVVADGDANADNNTKSTAFTVYATPELPYTEDFETVTSLTAFPYGQQSFAGSAQWVVASPGTNQAAHSGAKMMYLANSNNDLLFFPVSCTTPGDYLFSAWVFSNPRAAGTESSITLSCGTSLEAMDAVVDAEAIQHGVGYYEVFGLVNMPAAGVYYMGIEANYGYDYYLCVDDISVAPAAAADAMLTGFTAPTGMLVSGSEVETTVTLRNRGTAPLTAAYIDWTVNGVAQTQFVWTGNLAFGQSENVALGTVTLEGDELALTATVTATDDANDTNNGAELTGTVYVMPTVPFFEGFETVTSLTTFPYSQQAVSGSAMWTIKTGTASDPAYEGSKAMSLNYNKTTWLFFPVNYTEAGLYQMSAWAWSRYDGAAGNSIKFAMGAEPSAAAMTTEIASEQVIFNEYFPVQEYYTVETPGVYYMGVLGEYGNNWYLLVDNIAIRYIPEVEAALAMAPVTAFSTDPVPVKATLTNNGAQELTAATINWSVDGVDREPVQWTGSLAMGASAEVALGNIVPTTDMDQTYQVAANVVVAGDADAANDTAATTVYVMLPAPLPFSCDFENQMVGWQNETVQGTKQWTWTEVGAFVGDVLESTTADNGYAMFDLNDDGYLASAVQEGYMTSRPLSIPAGDGTIVMSFEHFGSNAGASSSNTFQHLLFSVEASNDGGASWTEIWAHQCTENNEEVGGKAYAIIPDALRGAAPVQLRFGVLGSGGFAWLVDDVNIAAGLSNDLAVTAVRQVPGVYVQGGNALLQATVLNSGVTTQTGNEVTFTLGELTATAPIGTLAIGESEVVTATVALPAEFVTATARMPFTATVADDEDNANNAGQSDVLIATADRYVEGFEGTLDWTTTSSYIRTFTSSQLSGLLYPVDGDNVIVASSSYGLSGPMQVTQQLDIAEGDQLHVWVNGLNSYEGYNYIVVKYGATNDPYGTWTVLDTLAIPERNWQLATVDLAAAVGENYLMFAYYAPQLNNGTSYNFIDAVAFPPKVPAGRVAFSLMQADSTTVSAAINIWNQDSTVTHTFSTNAMGVSNFSTLLRAGEWNYRVTTVNYYTRTGTFTIEGDQTTNVEVHDMVMMPRINLLVRDVDSDANITYANVSAKQGDTEVVTGTTNSSGVYSGRMPAGSYTLAVSNANYYLGNYALTLADGDDLYDTLLMQRWPDITLKVVESVAQEPLQGAQVNFMSVDSAITKSYTTNASGVTTSTPLPIGEYTGTVLAAGYGITPLSFEVTSNDSPQEFVVELAAVPPTFAYLEDYVAEGLDFGSVPAIGGLTASEVIGFGNIGSDTLEVAFADFAIAGPDAAFFSLPEWPADTVLYIASGYDDLMEITFGPATEGREFNATLTYANGGETIAFALTANTWLPEQLPIFDDFESGNLDAWYLAQEGQTNAWHVGTAAGDESGALSAIISNDGGATNAYSNNSTSTSHMYRNVYLPSLEEFPGELKLYFRWKGKGESTYDFMWVSLRDDSYTPVAGSPAVQSTNAQVALGRIGADKYNLSDDWQEAEIVIPNEMRGQVKRLIFSWRNDGSVGDNPTIAVDYVRLTPFVVASAIEPAVAGMAYKQDVAEVELPAEVAVVTSTEPYETVTFPVVWDADQLAAVDANVLGMNEIAGVVTVTQGYALAPEAVATLQLTVEPGILTEEAWPTLPTLTYGDALQAANLVGGSFTYLYNAEGEEAVEGTYSLPLHEGQKPAVADGQSVNVVFTPLDQNFITPSNTVPFSVEPYAASITITSLTHFASGEPREVTVTTAPTVDVVTGQPIELNYTVEYEGVEGTVYGPSAEGPTAIGHYQATVTIDEVNYTGQETAIMELNDKQMPEVVWPTLSSIAYGQSLAAATIVAEGSASFGGAPVAGAFALVDPTIVPLMGVYNAAMTFTPEDQATYNVVTGTVPVSVIAAVPTVISWPTMSALTYGQPVSAAALAGGEANGIDGQPLAGLFTVDTAATTVYAAGTHTVALTFTAYNANYATVAGTAELVVAPAQAVIATIPTASELYYGQTLADVVLEGGVATSEVTNQPVEGLFAFADATVAPEVGAMAYTVGFTPADTDNYIGAQTEVTVTTAKATPVIAAWPTASDIYFGQLLMNSTLEGGEASVEGTFAFANLILRPEAGAQNVDVIFTPADAAHYTTVATAADEQVTVNVLQTTPTIATAPTATPIFIGQTLAESTLEGGQATGYVGIVPGTFAFADATIAPALGTYVATVVFTPENTVGYTTATCEVEVEVELIPYEVTFTVNDVQGALEGATVEVGGQTATTDATGVAVVMLTNETYPYTVSKAGYVDAEGTVTVADAPAAVTVTLEAAECVAPTDLVATVTNHNVALTWSYEGATAAASIAADADAKSIASRGAAEVSELPFNVYRDGQLIASDIYETQYTDANLADGTYEYYVTVVCPMEESGASNTATAVVVTYYANFTVTDEAGAPLQGASIGINGATLTTDAAGAASIALDNGTYGYTVSMADYQEATGEVVIANASANVAVALQYAPCEAPANLEATVNGNNVNLTWQAPAAAGMVTVILQANDVWGDGSGYQMLLDADADAYGSVIPTTGALASNCSAPATLYDPFEFTIPTNADPVCTTSNAVIDGTVQIEIPAGVYDFCITNPTPGDRIWIASGEYGRYNDFTFEAGMTYHFTVALNQSSGNDAVTLNVTGGKGIVANEVYNVYRDGQAVATNVSGISYTDANLAEGTYEYYVTQVCGNGESAPSNTATATVNGQGGGCEAPVNLTATLDGNNATLAWEVAGKGTRSVLFSEDFETIASQAVPAGWIAIDADGDGYNWYGINQDNIPAHSGNGHMSSASYQNVALTPDNYLIMPQIPAGATTLKYYVAAQDAAYAGEHYSVIASTTGTAIADFTTVLHEETMTAKGAANVRPRGTNDQGTWYERVVEIPVGTQYIAFRHFDCVDMFRLCLDDVSVEGVEIANPFNVYRNGQLIASQVMAAAYVDENLADGTYEYYVTQVCADGESAPSNTATVTLGAQTVTFAVVDEAGQALQGATVAVAGQSLTTNASGNATATLANGDYQFTVNLLGYDEYAGEFTVNNAALTVDVAMVSTLYTVTFTAIDQVGAPLAAVVIRVGTLTLVTNAQGVVTRGLANGDYSYTASKNGVDVEGEFTVDNADVDVAIEFPLVGVEALDAAVRLYPNPASSLLHIERAAAGQATVEIYNNAGLLMMSLESDATVSTVDVSNLASGAYFVRVVGAEQTSVMRFVKH